MELEYNQLIYTQEVLNRILHGTLFNASVSENGEITLFNSFIEAIATAPQEIVDARTRLYAYFDNDLVLKIWVYRGGDDGDYSNTSNWYLLHSVKVPLKVSDLENDLEFQTKSEVNSALEDLKDTIDEELRLAIRVIDEAISKKYTKPSTGIPAADLASAVQTSLGKADSALPASDVVDNLTTEDATKALSAKQGKVLGDAVNQLGQDVNSTRVPTLNIEQGQILFATGYNSSSSSRIRTNGYLEAAGIGIVTSGNKVGVFGYDANNIYVGCLTFFTQNTNVFIPRAVKYRIVFGKSDDSAITPADYSSLGISITLLFKGNLVKTSQQTFKDSEKAQARMNIGAAAKADTIIYDETTGNVISAGTEWLPGYIDSSGRILGQSPSSVYYTNKIPIVSDTPIVVNQLGCNTAYASLAAYDENDNFIAECSINQSTGIPSSSPVTISTLGKDVAYIRVMKVNSVTPKVDATIMVEVESVKEAVAEIQEQLGNISIGTQWNGKSWVALGTSITDTKNTLAPDGTSTGKFVPFLVSLSGLLVTDKGVAGAVIGGHILYYAGHSTETANANIVTIEGGVNDWAGNRPLGQVGDTVPYLIEWTSPAWNNGGSAEGTFAGACYQAIKTAMDNSPKALVVILTDNTGQYIAQTGQHCERERQNSLGLLQKDYTDMLIAVAHYMGVPVINAGQRSMINQDNPEYLIDQIHQTELGGEQYANIIWSDLKDLPCRITE